MGGALLIGLWLGIGSADAACPDLDTQVSWAQEEVVLEVNARAARTALTEAERALECGPPQGAPALARLFLIEAAASTLEGDSEAVQDALAAARRIHPDTWIEALGPRMRAQFDAAVGDPGAVGSLDLDLPQGWVAHIDGAPAELPAQVAGGLHVLQVVGDGEVGLGRVLWVTAGDTAVVNHSLAPIVPKEVPEPVIVEPEPEPRASVPLALSIGFGAGAAFGQALSGVRADGTEVGEPGAKLTLPLELGAVLVLDGLWVRPTVGVAPLVGGQFLWAGAEGASASGVALLGDLAAAVDVGPLDAGGSVGMAFPGRIAVRGLAGMGVGDTPLYAELRAGLNLATGGRFEPAVGLAISARVP